MKQLGNTVFHKSRGRDAQSSLVSTLLLISASVGLSSIVLFWGLSYLSESQSSYSSGIFQSNAKVAEQFEIEEIYWNPTEGSLTVYVRNFGDQPVTIDRLLIDGEPQTVSSVVVVARAVQPLTVTFSWSEGVTYKISVGSSRGNFYAAEAKAKSP